jgi:hypothetical protein
MSMLASSLKFMKKENLGGRILFFNMVNENKKQSLEEFCEDLGIKLADDYITEQCIREQRGEKPLRHVFLYWTDARSLVSLFIVSGKMLSRLQERGYDLVEVHMGREDDRTRIGAYTINISPFIKMYEQRAEKGDREVIV